MSAFTHTVLVTGGTTGLGYQCALKIAQEKPNYKVIVASRSNANDAANLINKAVGRQQAEYLSLDLSSKENVRKFVTDYVTKKYPPMTSLVLNAALQFPGQVEYNADGIEKTFAITHVGHALLFYLIRPQLAPDARIVITSSGTHDPAQKTGVPDAIYNSAEELAHPNAESSKFPGRQRYATSKLCNVLWTYALEKHLQQSNDTGRKWTATAFDPGLMPGTGLLRDANEILQFLWNHTLPHMQPLLKLLSSNIHTPQQSGAALARLAVGADVAGVSGKYFEGMKEISSSVDSNVVEKQEDLWNWTINFLAKDEAEKKSFQRV